MIVKLRNPNRDVIVDRPMTVGNLLTHLGLNRESHLVIENGELVPRDKTIGLYATVEIRPVISGGSR